MSGYHEGHGVLVVFISILRSLCFLCQCQSTFYQLPIPLSRFQYVSVFSVWYFTLNSYPVYLISDTGSPLFLQIIHPFFVCM